MRRFLRTALKALAILSLSAAVGVGFWALLLRLDLSQEPPGDLTGAGPRRLLAAASKAGGRDLFPIRLTGVEDDLKRARFELNLQLAGLWGTRDYSRPTRLMDLTQRDAARLWRDVSTHRTQTKASAELAIEAARLNLESAAAITAVSAQEPFVHAKLASASIGLQRARACWDGARYDQALACARESIKASALAHGRSRQVLARYDDPHHLEAWHAWLSQAVGHSRTTGGTSFVVVKERHVLDVYKAGKKVHSIPVDLGANSINQKLHAGDRTTPEGLYRITQKKRYGQSKYGQALLLDYPNAEDRRRFQIAKDHGQLTKRTVIGGLIEIHGDGGRGADWTDGCIAPDNRDMATLFDEASVGTMVAIVGSDGGNGPVRAALRLTVRR